MRFWDSSAILPLLVEETHSSRLGALLDEDTTLTVWWATEVECSSALARAEREGRLDTNGARAAFDALNALVTGWVEVQAAATVRSIATRLVRVHPLRAADALQLAAAIVAAAREPATLPFVTLDERLALAAEREGFPVMMPGAHGA